MHDRAIEPEPQTVKIRQLPSRSLAEGGDLLVPVATGAGARSLDLRDVYADLPFGAGLESLESGAEPDAIFLVDTPAGPRRTDGRAMGLAYPPARAMPVYMESLTIHFDGRSSPPGVPLHKGVSAALRRDAEGVRWVAASPLVFSPNSVAILGYAAETEYVDRFDILFNPASDVGYGLGSLLSFRIEIIPSYSHGRGNIIHVELLSNRENDALSALNAAFVAPPPLPDKLSERVWAEWRVDAALWQACASDGSLRLRVTVEHPDLYRNEGILFFCKIVATIER